MDRRRVIATLREHESELRQRGVQHAALFGSLARGTATKASDIDILVEIDPTAPVDLFAYAGIKSFIADLFEEAVDVVDRDALKSHLRSPADRDAVYAF